MTLLMLHALGCSCFRLVSQDYRSRRDRPKCGVQIEIDILHRLGNVMAVTRCQLHCTHIKRAVRTFAGYVVADLHVGLFRPTYSTDKNSERNTIAFLLGTPFAPAP
jgi:hypothetical protein